MKSTKAFLVIFSQLLPFWGFSQFGQLDSTFNNDGAAFFSFQGGWARAAKVAVLPEGKILVAGTAVIEQGGGSKLLLLRFQENGKLDESFANGGHALYDWNGADDVLGDMAVLPDERINIVGSTSQQTEFGVSYFSVLMQVLPNGGLDSSFGVNGLVYSNDKVTAGFPMKILTLPDGKLLRGTRLESSTIQLARFEERGELDKTFGINGYAMFSYFWSYTSSFAMDIFPNGQIAMLVSLLDDTATPHLDFLLLDKEGTLLENGVTFDFHGLTFFDCKHDSLDRIVTAGTAIPPVFNSDEDWHCFASRFNLDGKLDESFATTGTRLLETGGVEGVAHSLDLDLEGNIVLAGKDGQIADEQAFIARLTEQGNLDGRFDEDGQLFLNFSGKTDAIYSVAIDQRERILAAGQSGDSLMVVRVIGSDYTPPPPPEVVSEYYFRCWPNPVGATINLEYALPENSTVDLALWDMMGRRVANLLSNADKEMGHYWESLPISKDIPNGAYWLRFRAGDFKAEQKIIKAP